MYLFLKQNVRRTQKKIFRTESPDVVTDCMLMFNCQKAEDAIFNRNANF